MKYTSAIYMLLHVLNWRLHWGRHDTHYRFTSPENPKFMGPRDAAKLIKDGDFIGLSGLGSSQWVSILHWAVLELYKETGHPRNLSYLAIGGIGSRGRAPGSVEEVGVPGLTSRLFAGHMETYKAMLKMADAGQCELQCMPQGVLASLIEAQGRGEDGVVTETGMGTFMDPRVGRGTPLAPVDGPQYVSVESDGRLRYMLPKINVCMWNAPAADLEGNIYLKHGSMISEIPELTRAVRRNNGTVIANVGLVVEKGYSDIFVPAKDVDAIVVSPDTEQVGSVKHRKYWPMFTLESNVDAEEGVQQLKFVNELLGITPRRTHIDAALARLAALVFAENGHKGSLVNIGVGLPEEVCRILVSGGLRDDITLFAESGVIGGLPAPGVFFGAAVSPKKMVSSFESFCMCYEKLDVSILGALQVDSDGNVNVSKRGEGAINYVGPGGFIDFTTAARTIIFVTTWMLGGKMALVDGGLRIEKRGKVKFVDKVDEITFSGEQALKAGKKVFYVTNVGVFRLTEEGMMLIWVMPGVDVQREIIDVSPMRVVLPQGGVVPVAPVSTITGKDFSLNLK